MSYTRKRETRVAPNPVLHAMFKVQNSNDNKHDKEYPRSHLIYWRGRLGQSILGFLAGVVFTTLMMSIILKDFGNDMTPSMLLADGGAHTLDQREKSIANNSNCGLVSKITQDPVIPRTLAPEGQVRGCDDQSLALVRVS